MSATGVAPEPSALPAARAAEGRPLPLWYTLVFGAVVAAASLYGLFRPDAYAFAAEMAAMARGGDFAVLIAVPLLVWAATRAHSGSVRAHLGWLGLVMYLTYGCADRAFGVPVNPAFLVYVAGLGLGSFGLLDGLLRIDLAAVAPAFAPAPRRAAAWLCLVSGGLFALLWLTAIGEALAGGPPVDAAAQRYEFVTYVIDLAWFIPLVVAAGVLLLRGHPAGGVLAAPILCALLALSMAVFSMTGLLAVGGYAVDPAQPVIFVILAGVTGGLLVTGAKRMDPVAGIWLRPGIWPQLEPLDRRE